MRILHVLDHSLPLHSGYTFRTRAILKAQIAHGWEVAAVTGPRQGESPAAEQVIDDLRFFRTPLLPALAPPFGEVREVRHFTRRIRAVAEDFRPDLLHAHSPVLDALAAYRVARTLRLPLVYEIRAFWEDAAVGTGRGREGSVKYRVTRALETHMAGKADAVAVICAGLRDDLVARGIAPDKIFLSPNGVDMSLFGEPLPHDAALAAELGVAGCETIGFIGSFYDYEGLDDLIAAMPLLVALRPALRLILVGGGPEEARLRAQAAASPAMASIHFVGQVPHNQVERYYSLIDVLVYPRKRMRLTELVTPLKPLEAMAQRRLVAASDVGGHRELIRDGDTGTLFAPDDPQAMAVALDALFADRAQWEARRTRARTMVEQERDWALNVACYDPVYHKLIQASDANPQWLYLSHA